MNPKANFIEVVPRKREKRCDKNWIPISLLDVDTKNSIKNLG